MASTHPRFMARRPLVLLLSLAGWTAAAACGNSAEVGSGGGPGSGADGGGGSGGSGGSFLTGDCPTASECGDECCTADQSCALETSCVPKQDPCSDSDDCWFDSYCLNGECTPYGLPSDHDHDESCQRAIDIGAIEPAEQCRWTGPPAGDASPNNVHVMATPVVVDFDFDNDPTSLHPSIIFPSFPTAGSYSNPGVLRVVDGATCAQQHSFSDAADAIMSPASVAVGDITSDGRPEIVAAAHGGGLLAFHYNFSTGAFERLWRSGTCAGGMPPRTPDNTGGSNKWSGPSIHDLDNDGSPEIIYGATVYRSNGCIASNSLGFAQYSSGYVPVIADVDEDGTMELVMGDGIFEWNTATSDWVAESYFKSAGRSKGHIAVADMGNFPLASLGNKDHPEVVVISSGTARIQTLEGTVVFGPMTLLGGGAGGPPTIADFDGDGKREFATAGGGRYIVYDFDCLSGGTAADCGGQSVTTGILWSQPSKDASSGVTGSSVFDFDFDGSAEAVYADECFLRIYEGSTGKVLYSAARSSGTTYENPIIVDVDGDYRTEIVSAVNDYAGTLGCPATDPLFATSTYARNRGIVVLRDVEDRWAASRPVWNQHAYAVTHVDDDGGIPASGAVKRNWSDAALNNFRQNVQGNLDALGVPDLTAGGDVGAVACDGTVATIEARVCNRGTLPMVGGTEVGFYRDAQGGDLLCKAAIPKALGVAECLVVSCDADLKGDTVNVFVQVDPEGLTEECWESNNAALYSGVACGLVPR